MCLILLCLLVLTSPSKVFHKHYEVLSALPVIPESTTQVTMSKNSTYEQQISAWPQVFKDGKPNDFEFESRNQAAFLLPKVPSYQTFLFFKKKQTKFILHVAFEYKQQDQLDGHGIQLVIINVKTHTKVLSCVFMYIKSAVIQIPSGPYLLTFRNKDAFSKLLKLQMGQEQESDQEFAEIQKMPELARDIQESRKQIHSMLNHHADDLLQYKNHLEAHRRNQSTQNRNTIIELVVIVVVNVIQLVFLRRLLEVKSII